MRLPLVAILLLALAPLPHAAAALCGSPCGPPQNPCEPMCAGASGECYDSDPTVMGATGGEDEAGVAGGSVVLPTGTGAANALFAFLNDPKGIPAGDACTAPGDDHLEAHAFVAGAGGVEVCYDGAVHAYATEVCDGDDPGDSG